MWLVGWLLGPKSGCTVDLAGLVWLTATTMRPLFRLRHIHGDFGACKPWGSLYRSARPQGAQILLERYALMYVKLLAGRRQFTLKTGEAVKDNMPQQRKKLGSPLQSSSSCTGTSSRSGRNAKGLDTVKLASTRSLLALGSWVPPLN